MFYVGHPHHYHVLREVADELTNSGHEVLFMARHKDVLLDLLTDQPHPCIVVSRREIRSVVLGRAVSILNREYRVLRQCLHWKPDPLAGTDLVITHVGRLLRVPSVVLDEDDAAVVPLMARFGFRFATHVLAPRSCDLGRYEAKKIAYEGFQELVYLDPTRFRADEKIVRRYGLEPRGYFLLRLASLSAHHDFGKRGIDDELARTLTQLLLPLGEVWISSERSLPEDLEARRLVIAPRDIHHVLAKARMLIADSQTMTAEAAVLGVPAVRYNDFVGTIGYLEQLERHYQLSVGINPPDQERLLRVVETLATDENSLSEWARRRAAMLEQTVDVARFFVETLTDCAVPKV